MNTTELFKPFYNLANNPKEIKDRYLKEGGFKTLSYFE